MTLAEISKQAGHPIPPKVKAIVNDSRKVVRCSYCKIVQWRTQNGYCRKCGESLWTALVIGKDSFIERELQKRLVAAVSARMGSLGLSINALADLILVHPVTLSRWLNGKASPPRLTMLLKVANVLGMSLAQLIQEVEGQ
jgi:hypothetical protein